jgi:hypothetical protein
MIEIGGFDVGRGAIGDGPDVSRQRFCVALMEAARNVHAGLRWWHA